MLLSSRSCSEHLVCCPNPSQVNSHAPVPVRWALLSPCNTRKLPIMTQIKTDSHSNPDPLVLKPGAKQTHSLPPTLLARGKHSQTRALSQ